jgi:hypothetical protein
VIQWRIHQFHNAENHRLGRFRLSVASHAGDLALGLSESLNAVAQTPQTAWNEAITKDAFAYVRLSTPESKALAATLAKENQALPEDEQVVTLKKRIERLSVPLIDDSRLVRMRNDVKESDLQRHRGRLTAAEDITWALINSPAFLFNH